MSSCFLCSSSEALRVATAPKLPAGGAGPVGVDGADVAGRVVGAPPADTAAAARCGSLTTVMDKLFLPGSMYVSLTHTIPSSRLALGLDEVGFDDADIDAAEKKVDSLEKPTNAIIRQEPLLHKKGGKQSIRKSGNPVLVCSLSKCETNCII